ncbi:hypothetical protein L2E82_45735 [Cichorium intybus]|uniref:Uncharacterized protein n=1 Tax=Cichorium intybus TaxID=13427 RepID=A0ACB8ZTP8_CICIN|nr:hypothetical protein L2E82_45735 [Cichorium intybus]
MARLLMLDFQLNRMAYELENWYHADLDFETFKLLQFQVLDDDRSEVRNFASRYMVPKFHWMFWNMCIGWRLLSWSNGLV